MKTPRLTSWTDLAINAAGAMAAAGQLAVAWGWLAVAIARAFVTRAGR